MKKALIAILFLATFSVGYGQIDTVKCSIIILDKNRHRVQEMKGWVIREYCEVSNHPMVWIEDDNKPYKHALSPIKTVEIKVLKFLNRDKTVIRAKKNSLLTIHYIIKNW